MDGVTSVVVVAADSGPLLHTCIGSLLAEPGPIDVVVVDNASADGEVDQLMAVHAHDTRLRALRNPANIGFGPACNRGAAMARGDVLVFLNPDCEIAPQGLEALRASFEADVTLGLLGVEVRDPEGRPARGNRRRDPSLRRILMTVTRLARLESRWPALAGVEMPATEPAQDIEDVEAISGACMALPRSVFARIGGFDEGYFLHAEDLDLCRRVRDAGLRVAIDHRLHAVHAQGSSSRHRPVFVSRHKHRGLWRYFTKFDPAARNPLLRAIVWLGLWGHFAMDAGLAALKGRPR